MSMQYMEEVEVADLIQELLNLAASSSWASRHGSVLSFSVLLRHNPAAISISPTFQSIVDFLKRSLKDEKVLHYRENPGNYKKFLLPVSDIFLHAVSSSRSLNEGTWKTSTPSNSERSFKHQNSW